MSVRDLVRERSGGVCERCGRLGSNMHHRIPRGMGGTKTKDVASVLIFLCGSGTTGCHGWVESHRSEAYETGMLVRRGSDPSYVPIVNLYGSSYYLTNDGAKILVTS